jgi:phosphoribosylaminoimidazole carboxylase (NCAIR synthetase)
MPRPEEILRMEGAHLHVYGKGAGEGSARGGSGRKIGHVTVCAATAPELKEKVARVRAVAGTP